MLDQKRFLSDLEEESARGDGVACEEYEYTPHQTRGSCTHNEQWTMVRVRSSNRSETTNERTGRIRQVDIYILKGTHIL